jgi:hypothetical protein
MHKEAAYYLETEILCPFNGLDDFGGSVAVVIEAKYEVLAEADYDAHRRQIVLVGDVDLAIQDVKHSEGVHVRAEFNLLL